VVAQIARLLIRIIGWALTPLVLILAAALGATITAFAVSGFSVTAPLVVMGIGGLSGAIAGSWGWFRLLGRSRRLRHALGVTPEGVPTEAAIAEVIGPEHQTVTPGDQS
jgi:hypothetical protein